MRNLLFLLACVFLLASCSSDKSKQASSLKENPESMRGSGGEGLSKPYQKEIRDISSDDLSALLGVELIKTEYKYNGFITYRKNAQGQEIKEGEVQLKGEHEVEVSEEVKVMVGSKITGNYLDGFVEGELTCECYGYENNETLVINFKGGRCLWSEITVEAEGNVMKHREEGADACSFLYIKEMGDHNMQPTM